HLSDHFGRKQVLIAGWLVAVPVPFLLMWASTWNWVLFANALLGVSQGLSWSATVIMKIDLVGEERRGFAMGLNEFAGYIAFAGAAMNIRQIGVLAAIYPATWGVVQLATGALSDKIGRKWLIVSGMWVQAAGIGIVIVSSAFGDFVSGLVLLGIGTAMVYPTL